MVYFDRFRRIEPQRRVENIVPLSAPLARRRRRGLFGIVRNIRIRTGHHHRPRFALPDKIVKQQHRRRPFQVFFPEIFIDRRFRSHDQVGVLRRLVHQPDQQFVLFALLQNEFFMVRVDIRLNDRYFRPFGRLFVCGIHNQRNDRGQQQRHRRSDPPDGLASPFPRFEHKQVHHQHPQRSAERTGVFVPLH